MFMDITITVPIWNMILGIVLLVAPIIWGIITMYFNQGKNKIIFDALITRIDNQDKVINFLDTKVDAHNDKSIMEFDSYKLNMERQLNRINETVIQTKTLVDLLVQNKISK